MHQKLISQIRLNNILFFSQKNSNVRGLFYLFHKDFILCTSLKVTTMKTLQGKFVQQQQQQHQHWKEIRGRDIISRYILILQTSTLMNGVCLPVCGVIILGWLLALFVSRFTPLHQMNCNSLFVPPFITETFYLHQRLSLTQTSLMDNNAVDIQSLEYRDETVGSSMK